MNLIPFPSAVLAGLLPVLAPFHPQRAVDPTPPMVTNWQNPIEVVRAEMANPFSNLAATSAPRLRDKEIPSKANYELDAWIVVDVSAEGSPGQIRPISLPACPEGAERCEQFDQVARQMARWSFDAGMSRGAPVAARATIGLRFEWEFSSISVGRVLYGPVPPDKLPPPVNPPLFDLESIVAARLAEGLAAEPPTGIASPESLEKLVSPPSRSVDVDRRTVPVAGDLLVHLTSAGSVDRILPVVVRPPVLWPFLKQVVSRWTFEPAKAGDTAVEGWIRVELLDGKADLSGESKRISSMKKSVPLRASAPGGKKP